MYAGRGELSFFPRRYISYNPHWPTRLVDCEYMSLNFPAVGGRDRGLPPSSIESFRSALTAARFAKVQPHQLHHVRLQQVDVPPGHALRLRQRARLRRVERRRGAVDRLLRYAGRIGGALHRRLAGGHVQHCGMEQSVFDKTSRRKTADAQIRI